MADEVVLQPARVIAERLLRRRRAPARAARRSTTSTCAAAPTRPIGAEREARAGAAAAALHHLVPDRRLPRRQRLLRRAHGAAVERVEQDRLRHRASAWRSGAAQPGAAKVVGLTSPAQPGVHARPRLLRRGRRLRRRDAAARRRPRGLCRHERRAPPCAPQSTARLRDRLAYSCSVGGTHWDALGGGKGLPGPRPVLFFAPAQTKKRVARVGRERTCRSASPPHGPPSCNR